jgi:hypothetical protein
LAEERQIALKDAYSFSEDGGLSVRSDNVFDARSQGLRTGKEKSEPAIPARSPHFFRSEAGGDLLQVPGIPALHGAHSPRQQAAAALQFILQAQYAIAHAEGSANLQQGIELTYFTHAHWFTHAPDRRR